MNRLPLFLSVVCLTFIGLNVWHNNRPVQPVKRLKPELPPLPVKDIWGDFQQDWSLASTQHVGARVRVPVESIDALERATHNRWVLVINGGRYRCRFSEDFPLDLRCKGYTVQGVLEEADRDTQELRLKACRLN